MTMVSSLKVLRSAPSVGMPLLIALVLSMPSVSFGTFAGLPSVDSRINGRLHAQSVGTPTKSDAVTRRLARAALSSGIAVYRQGFHKRSRFYLTIAEKHDRAWLDGRAEAHKLRALLYLSEDRPELAADSLVRSVRLKADPFLFYLLGNYNLRMRSYKQARASYRAAVLRARNLADKTGGKAGDGTRKKTVDPALRIITSELPFACPAASAAGNVQKAGLRRTPWVDAVRNPPFAHFERSESLWTRGLHPLEYAAAAYQALALNRYLRRKTKGGAPTADDDAVLLSELRRHDLARTARAGMKNLMGNRERDGSYRLCLRNLEALERKERKNIALGSTEPAVHRLKAIREAQRRMHRLRLSWFGDARAWFAFGSFLRRNGMKIEALHAFRKALELTPLELRAASLKGNLRERVQIYRLLAATYRQLGRGDDAESAAYFAHELENYQNESLDFATGEFRNGKAGARLIMKLLRRGRLYTWNREGLLLLIDHARNTGDARLPRYRRRLMERDQRYDQAELFSALRDYR